MPYLDKLVESSEPVGRYFLRGGRFGGKEAALVKLLTDLLFDLLLSLSLYELLVLIALLLRDRIDSRPFNSCRAAVSTF